MKYIVTKLGAFSLGLVGGLLVTFLFLNVTFAADGSQSGSLGAGDELALQGTIGSQEVNRRAGPPALSLRLSLLQQGGGGSGEGQNVYMPIILRNQ